MRIPIGLRAKDLKTRKKSISRPELKGGIVDIKTSYPVGEIPRIHIDIGVAAIGLEGIWMTAAWIYCLGKVIPFEAKKFADEAYDFLEEHLKEWEQEKAEQEVPSETGPEIDWRRVCH